MHVRRWLDLWLRSRDQGITTLEVAILFPAIFVPIFFAIQVEMYHYSRQVAFAAAERGMQQLTVLNTDGTPPTASQIATVQNTVTSYAAAAGGNWLTITKAPTITVVTDPSGQLRYRITVDATETSLGYVYKFTSTEVVEAPAEVFTHG